MRFILGLDLGQAADYTAMVVLDAHGDWGQRRYDVRHIEQFRLGTSYPTIVQAVGATLDREPLVGECTLAIDHTSVGRPVHDMFCAEHRRPIGITITGGVSWHKDPDNDRQWSVSKIMLVGTVQRFLQSGDLRIGAKLPHAATLQRELRDFRVKISKAANETYESREGAHDDLVLALAIALFVAENQGPPAISVAPGEMERLWAESGIVPEPRIQPRLWGRSFRRRYW
jgi:hypothetical protein